MESQIRHDLLQPGVLLLDLAQTLHLRRQHARVLLLPIEVGRLADPWLATDLRGRRSIVTLLEDERLYASVNCDAFIAFRSFSTAGFVRGKF